MKKEIKCYLCDLKKCKDCSYPRCRHTSDVNHAINKDAENFEPFGLLRKSEGDELLLFEVEGKRAETGGM